MNIFDRLTQAMGRFFSQLFGSSNENTDARKIVENQKNSLKRLADSLTELVFQRKKFEKRLEKLENKRINLKEDIEIAAMKDRDDLAIRLMEELDLVNSEVEETSSNLKMLTSEIETAKQVEIELGQQIKKSQAQLAVLNSRSQSVKMREDLHSQFSKIHQEFTLIQPDLSSIEENILKLESKLETLDRANPQWKQEVHQMRKERTDHMRKARLQQLKMELGRRSLPGQVIIPEIIKTH